MIIIIIIIARSVERSRHESRGRHYPYPHSTDQRSCLGADEMGQATRRELALGLRSAEASLAATRGRSRWRRGWLGLARLIDGGFGVLLLPRISSRDPEQ
jgi:hypothetical protein